jgi:hypothetical protein
VGWSRVAGKPEGPFESYVLTGEDLAKLPDPVKSAEDLSIPNPASTCMDRRLWSSKAYDVAYQTIYAALPDCRDCNCM